MQGSLTVNGQTTWIDVPPERTLLQLLRDDLGLKGTKDYCHSGVCGACTVLADGAAVSACSLLAAQVNGKSITTVERNVIRANSFVRARVSTRLFRYVDA